MRRSPLPCGFKVADVILGMLCSVSPRLLHSSSVSGCYHVIEHKTIDVRLYIDDDLRYPHVQHETYSPPRLAPFFNSVHRCLVHLCGGELAIYCSHNAYYWVLLLLLAMCCWYNILISNAVMVHGVCRWKQCEWQGHQRHLVQKHTSLFQCFEGRHISW